MARCYFSLAVWVVGFYAQVQWIEFISFRVLVVILASTTLGLLVFPVLEAWQRDWPMRYLFGLMAVSFTAIGWVNEIFAQLTGFATREFSSLLVILVAHPIPWLLGVAITFLIYCVIIPPVKMMRLNVREMFDE